MLEESQVEIELLEMSFGPEYSSKRWKIKFSVATGLFINIDVMPPLVSTRIDP